MSIDEVDSNLEKRFNNRLSWEIEDLFGEF